MVQEGLGQHWVLVEVNNFHLTTLSETHHSVCSNVSYSRILVSWRVDIGINKEVISSEFKDIFPPNKCVFSLWKAIIFSHKLVLRAIETKEKNDLKDDFFFPNWKYSRNDVFLGQKGSVAIWNFFIKRNYDNVMWKVLRWFRSLSWVCMV